jgi:hypothetical protein
MKLKTIVDEVFGDFNLMGMLIAVPECTTKCWARQGLDSSICQNDHLRNAPTMDIADYSIIKRYIKNENTKCIIFSGLDAYDSKDEIIAFIKKFRDISYDDIVIYTGRPIGEVQDFVSELEAFSDIYLKTGIYIPNSNSKIDKLTGVKLISDNQGFIGINLTKKCIHCKYKKTHSLNTIYCSKEGRVVSPDIGDHCESFERIVY